MKKILSLSAIIVGVTLFIALLGFSKSNNSDPWLPKQLMEPSELARIINNPKMEKPYIFSVGPGAVIKGSIDIGMVSKSENMAKFKEQLSKLPKNAPIVIYCGCCPFEHCPNIRPAFALLNEMKFINHKLLNLSTNIKVDWINKGYPVSNR